MNQKSLKLFYYIGLFLIFLPMFVIYIVPNTIGFIQISFIFCLLSFILAYYINSSRLKQLICHITKYRVIKFYFIFLFICTIISLIHILMNEYIAPVGYYAIRIYRTFILTAIIYFFPILSVYWNIPFNKLIKLNYIIIYIILIISVIQFFTYTFHIEPINYIFKFLTNARTALYRDPIEVMVKCRVHGFYGEPSGLGQLLFIMMPIVFNLVKNKRYKILKNSFCDIFVKKTFLPLLICVILMTKSPIYIILCLLELFILIIWQHRKNKLYILTLCTCSLIILLNLSVFYNLIADSIVTKRIIIVFEAFSDFTILSNYESSLATRIISYFQQIMVFSQHPILGVGIANIGPNVNKIFLQTPLPITDEMINAYFIHQNRTSYNGSVVYSTLAEVGIIGFSIWIMFIYNNFKIFNRIQVYLNDLQISFTQGLKQSLISCCVISFYNLSLDSTFLWYILGLCLLVKYQFFYNKGNITCTKEQNFS